MIGKKKSQIWQIHESLRYAEIGQFLEYFAIVECLRQHDLKFLFRISICHFQRSPHQIRYPGVTLAKTFKTKKTSLQNLYFSQLRIFRRFQPSIKMSGLDRFKNISRFGLNRFYYMNNIIVLLFPVQCCDFDIHDYQSQKYLFVKYNYF